MDLKEELKTWYNADGQFDPFPKINIGYFEPNQLTIDRALSTIVFLREKSIELKTYNFLSPYTRHNAGGIQLYFDCINVSFCVTYYNQSHKGSYRQTYKKHAPPIYLIPDNMIFKKFEHVYKLLEKQLLELQMTDIIET